MLTLFIKIILLSLLLGLVCVQSHKDKKDKKNENKGGKSKGEENNVGVNINVGGNGGEKKDGGGKGGEKKDGGGNGGEKKDGGGKKKKSKKGNDVSDKRGEEQEEKTLQRIRKCLCSKKGAGKEPKFINGLSKCKDGFPYEMRDGEKPHHRTRNVMYNKPEFTNKNRLETCDATRRYVENLKRQIAEYKGPLKSEYDSEEKLRKFFREKEKCFMEICEEHDVF